MRGDTGPVADMASYLTTTGAASTYQTIAAMASYAPLASPTFTTPRMTIGSQSYTLSTQPRVGGWFQFSSMTVIKQIGLNNFSVARTPGFATGSFDITFPAHPSGGSYMIIFTPRMSSGNPVVYGYGGSISATGFTVRFTNVSGTLVDAEFSLLIPPN